MKTLWLAAALLIAASNAVAQEQTCDAYIQTANAMMNELQEQMLLMSARAIQHYGRIQALSAELDAIRSELAQLEENTE